MTTAFTRRLALAGPAAVAAAAIPVGISPALNPDAELVALDAQFTVLAARYLTAARQHDELMDEYHRTKPPMPEALICTTYIGFGLGRRGPDGKVRYTERDVEHFRKNPYGSARVRQEDGTVAMFGGSRLHKECADKVVAAWDSWQAECARVYDALGIAAAEAVVDERFEEVADLNDRILGYRAVTIEGLRIKARVALWWSNPGEIHEDQDTDDTAERMVNSITRDLLGIAHPA